MTHNLAPALRGLGICALFATATTFFNTIAHHFFSASDFDSRMALIYNPVYVARQWVLLVHPAFTILLALGVALALFARAPGRSAAALIFAGVEKMTEFVLGVLILFVINPEWKGGYLTAIGTPAAAAFRQRVEVFNELLGGLFYLLWAMFILSTALFASALKRGRGLEGWFFVSAVAAVAITLVMLVGDVAGLEAWSGPIVDWLYSPVMTTHRALAGLWLIAEAKRITTEPKGN